MKRLNRKGFTLLEAIASFFIVSIVLTTATILIVNAHNQSVATSRQVDAVYVGSSIRDDIAKTSYTDVTLWMDGAAKTLTNVNCVDVGSPFPCTLFSQEVDGIVYDTEVVVTFESPTAESLLYKVIRYSIEITYYDQRSIVIEGMIYDGS